MLQDSSVLPSKTPGGDKLEKIEEEDNEERKSEAVEEEKIVSISHYRWGMVRHIKYAIFETQSRF